MAETADDLSAPLGQEAVRRKRRFRLPFTAMQALAVLLRLAAAPFRANGIFLSSMEYAGSVVAGLLLLARLRSVLLLAL